MWVCTHRAKGNGSHQRACPELRIFFLLASHGLLLHVFSTQKGPILWVIGGSWQAGNIMYPSVGKGRNIVLEREDTLSYQKGT